MMLVHGTALLIGGRAILLTGPAGSGKSDLALRMIDRGAMLIADDQTRLTCPGPRLLASAPDGIAGRLAVRGIGIVTCPHGGGAHPLSLVAALTTAPRSETAPLLDAAGPWLDRMVPRIALYPFETSAPIKLRLALGRFGL